jgi:exodeoxyribonuclease-3
MKLLAWNILHGGGTRVPRIVEEIAAHDPDVVALTGFRTDRGAELTGELKERGWPHRETSNPAKSINGIAVFSRTPLRRTTCPAPSQHRFRWLDLDLPDHGFGLAVLQLPAATRADTKASKRLLWDAVIQAAEARLDQPFLLTGAWNTGAHHLDETGKTYVCAEHFAKLSELGWIDLWRRHNPGRTEWTWYSSHGNGFRVDHAFASPSLATQVTSCRYSHVEREAKISDHSLLLLETK